MSANEIRISAIAKAETPEALLLATADAEGVKNDKISAVELDNYLARHGVPATMTQGKLNALKTSMLNTLAPDAVGRLDVKSYGGGAVLPTKLRMEEHIMTGLLGGSTFTTFDIKDAQSKKKVAQLERQWRADEGSGLLRNAFSAVFVLRNSANPDKDTNVVARSKPVIVNFESFTDNFRQQYRIEDGAGNRIGTIQERWVNVATGLAQKLLVGKKLVTYWEILDANDRVVARSDKTELLTTELVLQGTGTDASGKLASAKEDYLNHWVRAAGDDWTLETHQPGSIDRRLLVFAAAYKSWGDKKEAERRAANSSSSSSSSKPKHR
ncbi:MAG: hypothetical protein HY903_17755 [Deltaproteobacteria bacterium]|nr:hypothetical protein [Deltaproteobacteria bacterium]